MYVCIHLLFSPKEVNLPFTVESLDLDGLHLVKSLGWSPFLLSSSFSVCFTKYLAHIFSMPGHLKPLRICPRPLEILLPPTLPQDTRGEMTTPDKLSRVYITKQPCESVLISDIM